MLGSEYQLLASRTINKNLTKVGQEKHALHGLAGEIGELHSLYQKIYQDLKKAKQFLEFEIEALEEERK